MVIDNPKEYFDKLGGLHDADVLRIKISLEENAVSVVVDDLNRNFLGLPEYEGAKPSQIGFKGVKSIDIEFLSNADKIRIFAILVSSVLGSNDHAIQIKFSPGGHLNLTCPTVEVLDI